MKSEKTYNIHYWIWLSLRVSPGSSVGDILLDAFEYDPRAIYNANREDYEAIGKLSEQAIERLCDKDLTEAQKIRFFCEKFNIGLLAPDREFYPERLFNIPRRPLLLYYRGILPDLEADVMIACVGTRRMTEYGKRQAYVLSYDLARAGAVVVSGMAKGIDSCCHRGALDCGGKTIAVLGCGIDRVFPAENRPLYDELASKGAIITEFKPGTPPLGANFPIRNRILSGLCQGTLVVEADKRSGALITAREAKAQGRDVFALPGKVGELNSLGTNDLIKAGAKPVTEAWDILEEYEALYPNVIFPERLPEFRPHFLETLTDSVKPPKTPGDEDGSKEEKDTKTKTIEKAKKKKSSEKEEQTGEKEEKPSGDAQERVMPQGLSDDEKAVFSALCSSSSPMCADELSASLSMSVAKVMTALTLLEIKTVVAAIPGGRYILK